MPEIASDFIKDTNNSSDNAGHLDNIISQSKQTIESQVTLGSLVERPLNKTDISDENYLRQSLKAKRILSHDSEITKQFVLGEELDTQINTKKSQSTQKEKDEIIPLDPYSTLTTEQDTSIEQAAYDRGFGDASKQIELKAEELQRAFDQGFAEALRTSEARNQEGETLVLSQEQVDEAFQKGIEAAKADTAWLKEQTDAAYQKGQADLKNNSDQLRGELEASFEEGVEQGKEDAKRLVAEKVDEIFQAIEKMVSEKNKMLDEAKKPLVDFALSMAERIVQTEITQHPDSLLNLVDEGINKLLESDKVVIKANAENLKFLKGKAEYFEKRLPHIKTVIFQEENSIDSAGCIFETDLGFVEASLQAKIDILKEAMHHEDLHE